MRPILLKGHERSITAVAYNREGDLLFTASKSPVVCVWFTRNGERLGTFNGHSGALWCLDVDRNSERMLSASADNTVRLWNIQAGKELFVWTHQTPVRCCSFAMGDQRFFSITDQVMGKTPEIAIFELADDLKDQMTTPVACFPATNDGKVLSAQWGPFNKTILTACEDGTVRVYSVDQMKEVRVIADHKKPVMSLQFSQDMIFFITCSKDGYARLYDSTSFENIKSYYTGRPVNSAAISPLKYEIVLGGGQSAESVTTTRVDSAQFNSNFFHLIFQDETGSVQGHFGPVNVLKYHPDGIGFVSGGEDGYVRLHQFDSQYYQKDILPHKSPPFLNINGIQNENNKN